MDRKNFLKKTFQCGVISCIGIQFLSAKTSIIFRNTSKKMTGTKNNDEFLNYFGWIADALNAELTDFFEVNSLEHKILSRFKEGWGKRDSVELLNELSDEYGEKAKETVEQFIKINIKNDWPEKGKREAKEGTEVQDFIRVLWGPLEGEGFEFTSKQENDVFTFRVTKCPIFELAEKTNMHSWLYHMACATDYYTTPAFSREIGFSRAKTLMQKDDHCNHTYYYKTKVKTKDSLLGYCGLYCGACPNYHDTEAVKPVDYKKENFYETCEGCNSKIKAGWCAKCEIVACNKRKNTRICYDCDEYQCDVIIKFMNDKRYPYHKEVDDKMKLYKEKGLEEWLTIQEKSYKCKNCGTRFNFFQKKCTNCGIEL